MPSANNTSNSSNIKSSNTTFVVQQTVGSRLSVLLENETTGFLAPGLTAGDVIRYDAILQGYTRASADSAPNSEVFGIIESVKSNGSLHVITYGSIVIPEDHLLNKSGFNFGGNDVYFLSADSPGYLQNLPPTEIGQIIKPVFQIAPHQLGNVIATGTVINYVGYTIIDQG